MKKNYRIHNSCRNCTHVFIKYGPDDADQLFCNIENNRPAICGSVCMDESFFISHSDTDLKKARELMEIWNRWAVPREVSENGVCDEYCPKPKTI